MPEEPLDATPALLVGKIVLEKTTHVTSKAHEFIPRHEHANSLSEAVEAIHAHVNDRYELKLREGKSQLTHNEIAGIIATHLWKQLHADGPIPNAARLQGAAKRTKPQPTCQKNP